MASLVKHCGEGHQAVEAEQQRRRGEDLLKRPDRVAGQQQTAVDQDEPCERRHHYGRPEGRCEDAGDQTYRSCRHEGPLQGQRQQRVRRGRWCALDRVHVLHQT
jgi:hypothetical protein